MNHFGWYITYRAGEGIKLFQDSLNNTQNPFVLAIAVPGTYPGSWLSKRTSDTPFPVVLIAF